MRRFTLALLFAAIGTSAFAQKFLERFTLIETFDQTFKKNEPAIFSATLPDTGRSTFQIQGAMGFAIISDQKRYLNLIWEWHQNNEINKEQNVRQLGVAYTLVTGAASSSHAYFNSALKWSKDHEKQKESYTVTAAVSPYIMLGQ